MQLRMSPRTPTHTHVGMSPGFSGSKGALVPPASVYLNLPIPHAPGSGAVWACPKGTGPARQVSTSRWEDKKDVAGQPVGLRPGHPPEGVHQVLWGSS